MCFLKPERTKTMKPSEAEVKRSWGTEDPSFFALFCTMANPGLSTTVASLLSTGSAALHNSSAFAWPQWLGVKRFHRYKGMGLGDF